MLSLKIKKQLNGPSGKMVVDLNLEIVEGDFLTIYGESGAGKTSILRMIAGLMKPDQGVIKFNDQTWFANNQKINMKPQKRKVGFVFQDFALFPNMTVQENLEFALQPKQFNKIISEIIELTELGELRKRKISTLSGGQKQRVALARAVISKPEILLLDEPLSSLGLTMRNKLQDYLLKLHMKYKVTIIMVSHDIAEVYRLSNRIIHLKEGKIVKDGKPEEVFFNNKISGKFQFVGEVIKIEKNDIIYVISVLIGQGVVKVVSIEDDIKDLSIGHKVLVASKAFNPIVKKLTD